MLAETLGIDRDQWISGGQLSATETTSLTSGVSTLDCRARINKRDRDVGTFSFNRSASLGLDQGDSSRSLPKKTPATLSVHEFPDRVRESELLEISLL